MMLRVLGRIMKKEFIQTFRDKRMLAVILFVPVFQTTVFGFAVNMDLVAQPIVIADMDHSRASRELVESVSVVDSFEVVGFAENANEAEEAVLLGRAALALLIPFGFEHDQARGDAEVMVILDGSDSNTALRAGQDISQTLTADVLKETNATMRRMIAAKGLSADSLVPKIEIASRAWFNPNLRSAVFFVPGVLGMVLMVITMLLTSLGLTREKEIGTLEQIMVTPIKPWQLIVGKTLPFAILGLVDVLLIINAAALIFDLPPQGPIWGLLGAATLFLLTTLGLGLFISTISATQQQAMMNAFFFMLPALMLSGFIYPIENMPEPVQWLTTVNPLRYFLTLVRAIMVKGANPLDLWDTVLKLGGLGLLVIGMASMRFRKRLA